MHTSWVPRFLISVSTWAQNFAPFAAVADPQPQDVALALDGHTDGHVIGRFATWPARIFTWTASMNTTG